MRGGANVWRKKVTIKAVNNVFLYKKTIFPVVARSLPTRKQRVLKNAPSVSELEFWAIQSYCPRILTGLSTFSSYLCRSRWREQGVRAVPPIGGEGRGAVASNGEPDRRARGRPRRAGSRRVQNAWKEDGGENVKKTRAGFKEASKGFQRTEFLPKWSSKLNV